MDKIPMKAAIANSAPIVSDVVWVQNLNIRIPVKGEGKWKSISRPQHLGVGLSLSPDSTKEHKSMYVKK